MPSKIARWLFYVPSRLGRFLFGNQFAAVIGNRRRHKRDDFFTLLTVQFLDVDFTSAGKKIWAMSRNISLGGLGLTCPEEITSKYVRITIDADQRSWVSVIRHQQQVSECNWLAGVEFIDDMVACAHPKTNQKNSFA